MKERERKQLLNFKGESDEWVMKKREGVVIANIICTLLGKWGAHEKINSIGKISGACKGGKSLFILLSIVRGEME